MIQGHTPCPRDSKGERGEEWAETTSRYIVFKQIHMRPWNGLWPDLSGEGAPPADGPGGGGRRRQRESVEEERDDVESRDWVGRWTKEGPGEGLSSMEHCEEVCRRSRGADTRSAGGGGGGGRRRRRRGWAGEGIPSKLFLLLVAVFIGPSAQAFSLVGSPGFLRGASSRFADGNRLHSTCSSTRQPSTRSSAASLAKRCSIKGKFHHLSESGCGAAGALTSLRSSPGANIKVEVAEEEEEEEEDKEDKEDKDPERLVSRMEEELGGLDEPVAYCVVLNMVALSRISVRELGPRVEKAMQRCALLIEKSVHVLTVKQIGQVLRSIQGRRAECYANVFSAAAAAVGGLPEESWDSRGITTLIRAFAKGGGSKDAMGVLCKAALLVGASEWSAVDVSLTLNALSYRKSDADSDAVFLHLEEAALSIPPPEFGSQVMPRTSPSMALAAPLLSRFTLFPASYPTLHFLPVTCLKQARDAFTFHRVSDMPVIVPPSPSAPRLPLFLWCRPWQTLGIHS
jgi:hypothetical protein